MTRAIVCVNEDGGIEVWDYGMFTYAVDLEARSVTYVQGTVYFSNFGEIEVVSNSKNVRKEARRLGRYVLGRL